MTKHISLDIKVQKPFGNLFRKKVALIAVENADGDFLVGAKPYAYPPTITRLLGGGVDEGEHEDDAAVRELGEELGITIDPSELTPLLVITVNAEDAERKHYKHETYVYYANIGDTQYKPADDIESVVKLSLDELYALGEAYEALPETLWYNGRGSSYSWSDYAKLYGPVHKLSAEEIRSLKS
ncbi:MAG: NUDIX hydrolase [Candidatus Microsaccharimonas sp.]